MRKRRKKLTTLIISLLLHMLVLLFIMFNAFKHRRIFLLSKNLAKPKIIQLPEAHQMPAALLPKQSDHGTEVFFDIGASSEIDEEEHPAAAETETQTKQEPTPETMHKQVKEEPPAKVEEKVEATVKNEPAKAVVEPQVAPEVEKEMPREKHEEKRTIFIENLERTALANIIKKATPQKSTQKKKSVLSLAQCFMNHEKGNSSLFKFGEDRKPTLEEMKYYCYEQQIQRCLRTSWKIVTAGIPKEQLIAQKSIWWRYVINEHGGVEDLEMTQSSGNAFFDELVMRVVRQTKFPPIPKHFGVKRYRPRGGYVMLH